MTLSQKLKIPPCLCRILAIKPGSGRLLTNQEIASRGRMSKDTVHRLSCLQDWKSVPVGMVDRFATGTGINPIYTEKTKRTLRRLSTAFFLKNASPAQRKMVRRALDQLKRFPSTYRY